MYRYSLYRRKLSQTFGCECNTNNIKIIFITLLICNTRHQAYFPRQKVSWIFELPNQLAQLSSSSNIEIKSLFVATWTCFFIVRLTNTLSLTKNIWIQRNAALQGCEVRSFKTSKWIGERLGNMVFVLYKLKLDISRYDTVSYKLVLDLLCLLRL